MDAFPGKLAIQQRVLPTYRAPFVDELARRCTGGLSVFAGLAQPEEQIPPAERLEVAHLVRANNRHFGRIASPLYQCWQPGLLDWLEDWQPDVLIVEANPRYRSTPAALAWMHAHGKTVLGWGLGAPAISGPLASLRSAGRTRFLRALDGMVAYSARGAAEYQALGFPADRVFVARNATASRPAQPPPQRPLQWPGKPVVLFVGRLQARKRIDALLRACAALPPEQQPEVVIVGDGPARPDFERAAQEHYPAAFTGALFGDALAEQFLRSDLFVLPGTGGLAVQQAMSFGLPVIVAQGDGTQGDLVRAENGWNIPPDDDAALLAALREALSDPARLRRMGGESYRVVAEEANVEAMADVFVQAALKVYR
jgi:glycosyltransferase involved in cell wall biosynthesis